MRIRRRHKPCARCGHFQEIHAMLIMDRERREVRVPCGHVELTPAFGGLFRYKACDCPGYVAPAGRRLRLANRLLGQITNPGVWALIFVIYLFVMVLGLDAGWWSL